MASMNLEVGIQGLKRGTNILTIEVPEPLKHKKKTGIDWFDDAIGGEGFTPSTSMMVTGGPGCGKTTLFLQLANAITKAGHIALANTGEESLYQVRMVTERLNLKDGFICGQDTMAPDFLEHADELWQKNPGKQLFILQDSLQTLNDGKYKDGGVTGNTPLRCCEMLTNWAKKKRTFKERGKDPVDMFGIVIFIGQVTKSGDFAGKNQIRHAVDVHGHLFFDDDKKSETYGERLFEVNKNRFGCNGKTYVIGIDKNGLHEKAHFVKAA
jgi:predicted ATP-dependent serine protease